VGAAGHDLRRVGAPIPVGQCGVAARSAPARGRGGWMCTGATGTGATLAGPPRARGGWRCTGETVTVASSARRYGVVRCTAYDHLTVLGSCQHATCAGPPPTRSACSRVDRTRPWPRDFPALWLM